MKISIADAIQRTVEHREIFHDEMLHVMRQIMSGELTQAQIAGFIMGLRVKKETIGEISAAAQVMREFATQVEVGDDKHLVDTCGTGGDSAHTFNVSTASAIVAAAAGAKVAKHMGRSVSSSSGSADVLEAMGANIALTPALVGKAIEEIGLGFMFAPSHHAAMKYAAPVRKELGVRTIFNLLGPLTNPANAKNQVMGVFHPDLVGIQVRVLQRLGARHALAVFGVEGLDEISISGETRVGELKDSRVTEYTIHPEQFGMPVHDSRVLRVTTVEESRAMVLQALDARPSAQRDIVTLNAGAAIYAADCAATLHDGIDMAKAGIASGAARAKLDEFVRFTQKFGARAG